MGFGSHCLAAFPPHFATNSTFPLNPSFHRFPSEPVLAHADYDHAVIADVFSNPMDSDDVKHLDSNHVSINHNVVVAVLWKHLDSNREVMLQILQCDVV